MFLPIYSGYFNTFQPTQQLVHLSAPNGLCSSSVGCYFHRHLPTGSASTPNLFQCSPTLPFLQALFVFLHSSIWLMSHRNENHSRDTMSDTWFHFSSFLYVTYLDGWSSEQDLLLLVLFTLQSRIMAFQVWLVPRLSQTDIIINILLTTTATTRISAALFLISNSCNHKATTQQ